MEAAAHDGCRICIDLWADWQEKRSEHILKRQPEEQLAFSAATLEGGNLDDGYSLHFKVRFDRKEHAISIGKRALILDPLRGALCNSLGDPMNIIELTC